MAQRMLPPAVAEDLRRLGITRVSTLLARQVHSDEGQLAFAGTGQVNTDDHNVLEYLSPIAYFMSGEAVALFDERISGGDALAFTPYAKAHPLDGAAWGELYENLHHVHGEGDALLRSVAERWLVEAPGEYAPSVALARCQLAQDDLSAAMTTLAAQVNVESPGPEVMSLYLQAVARQRAHRGSVFQASEVTADLERARAVLARNPNYVELREALELFAE
jgi:spermidine synthase